MPFPFSSNHLTIWIFGSSGDALKIAGAYIYFSLIVFSEVISGNAVSFCKVESCKLQNDFAF